MPDKRCKNCAHYRVDENNGPVCEAPLPYWIAIWKGERQTKPEKGLLCDTFAPAPAVEPTQEMQGDDMTGFKRDLNQKFGESEIIARNIHLGGATQEMREVCEWTVSKWRRYVVIDEDTNYKTGYYETGCGSSFNRGGHENEYDPMENDFCPHCGKRIVVKEAQ